MWRVSGKVVNGQAIIKVGLQKFLPTITSVQAVSQPVAMPVSGGYRALIDTGAQMTCITHKAIRENGLRVVGRQDVAGVDGPSSHKAYSFHIGFECEAVRPVGSGPTYYQWEHPQTAIDIPDNGQFDVIIGMNILGTGDLRFMRDGSFLFEFG